MRRTILEEALRRTRSTLGSRASARSAGAGADPCPPSTPGTSYGMQGPTRAARPERLPPLAALQRAPTLEARTSQPRSASDRYPGHATGWWRSSPPTSRHLPVAPSRARDSRARSTRRRTPRVACPGTRCRSSCVRSQARGTPRGTGGRRHAALAEAASRVQCLVDALDSCVRRSRRRSSPDVAGRRTMLASHPTRTAASGPSPRDYRRASRTRPDCAARVRSPSGASCDGGRAPRARC